MPFSLPDKGEGVNDIQSILFQEYLDILIAGMSGIDCVLNGGVVTAQGAPNMTVAITKAGVISNGVLLATAASASLAIGAADGTNPRIDLVVVTSAGAFAVRAGTAAAAPKPPTRTANDVVLAAVFIPASDTTIATNQITDLRVMRGGATVGGGGSAFVLKKVTTAVTFNTTSAIQTYFTCTIPDGLFITGQLLRLRCGGTYLINNGVPTLTLTISFGGTTMFADVSIAGSVDADRGAWWLDFDIKAVSNTSQVLNGMITYQNTVSAGRVAPTTGVGDMLGSVAVAGRPVTTPIKGVSAVDANAANRDLLVRWTMSVSNIADEMSMEGATLELI